MSKIQQDPYHEILKEIRDTLSEIRNAISDCNSGPSIAQGEIRGGAVTDQVTPHTCPVCCGGGQVFGNCGSGINTVPCQACGGSGVLWR